MGRLLPAFLLLSGLFPSAWLAWHGRTMPQTGIYHDDAIYVVTAKSLAERGSYRIESLPERPYQTKYPPLWPALLAGVWKLSPAYPANLPWMAMLVWAFLPLTALLSWKLLESEGFAVDTAAILAAIGVVSPATVVASTLLLSELPFLAALLASLLAAGKDRPLLAGVLAGAAFLTRSAALPLAAVVPAWFLWRRQWRSAGLFAAAMLPAVAGWQWWTASHGSSNDADPLTLFYTSYLGYWKLDAGTSGLPDLVWGNTGALLNSLGHLLAFDATGDFLPSMLARAMGAAAIAGVIRLVRAGRFRLYTGFAAVYCLQLLVWNYPPTSRFALPLLPLAVAGAWTEFSNLGAMVKSTWVRNRPGDRVAAALTGAVAATALAVAAMGNFDAIFRLIPESYAQHAGIALKNRTAIEWLRTATPEDARVLSYADPAVFLMTGRRGYSLRVPPGMQKRGDRAEIERYFAQLPSLSRLHGIGYVLLSITDYHLDTQELTWPAYRDQVRRTFREQLTTGSGGIYVANSPPK